MFGVDGLACACGGRLVLHAIVQPPATLGVLDSLWRSTANRQPSVCKTSNALVTEYNQRLDDQRSALTTGQPRAVQQSHADIEAMQASVEQSKERCTRLEGAVVDRFETIRTVRVGPTSYGETSPEEAFAESFALYHLDPDALGRIDPAVLEWFRSSGHLEGYL